MWGKDYTNFCDIIRRCRADVADSEKSFRMLEEFEKLIKGKKRLQKNIKKHLQWNELKKSLCEAIKCHFYCAFVSLKCFFFFFCQWSLSPLIGEDLMNLLFLSLWILSNLSGFGISLQGLCWLGKRKRNSDMSRKNILLSGLFMIINL